MNQPKYLIISDFDGTLFETSLPSPSGITVKEAYSRSLDDIFGLGTGKDFFDNFGFKGEGPSQIIESLLHLDRQRFLEQGRLHNQKEQGALPHIIPEVKDGSITWNTERPDISLSQMLVVKKLGHLLEEIGALDEKNRPWPLPCEGVLDFMKTLKSLQERGTPVDLAIVSSGHESFIRKTLDVWNLQEPNILITEDDMRRMQFPQEAEKKFKPAVLPIALAHLTWLKQQDLVATTENGRKTRSRIMHIGDSSTKDLVMAQKAGIEVNLLFPQTPWEHIARTFISNRYNFDGRPFSEIFRPQNEKEFSIAGMEGRSRRKEVM